MDELSTTGAYDSDFLLSAYQASAEKGKRPPENDCRSSER
jgi:hypothetical protein